MDRPPLTLRRARARRLAGLSPYGPASHDEDETSAGEEGLLEFQRVEADPGGEADEGGGSEEDRVPEEPRDPGPSDQDD